jgi:hypothetical protein
LNDPKIGLENLSSAHGGCRLDLALSNAKS